MLKALRKHFKSKKSTNFMQYMKISRKEANDNNWINFRNLDEITNELETNLYRRDCFELITSNNFNNYKHNNCYNYNNGRKQKEIKQFEAIQLNHQHLHALHRFRRHRKRGISSEKNVVISFSPKSRVSIVNRPDFYYRFGKLEQEAIACFDFLNDIPCDTDSIYDSDSTDTEERFRSPSLMSIPFKDDDDLNDSSIDRNNSQLSLSDSCVEYYDSSD